MKSVLTIAGSDSSGGAGIQADIKTITAHHLFAQTAITALTAQNTTGVFGMVDVDPEFVQQQIDVVFDDIRPDAVKIGMVSSPQIVSAIAGALKRNDARNIVLDPVMVSTSKAKLISDDAIESLKAELIPLATVVTPNMAEAEVLCGFEVLGAATREKAALEIIGRYGAQAVYVKGGHSATDADDVLVTAGGHIRWYSQCRVLNPNTHGTGCTLSSAIACGLAEGLDLSQALDQAKRYITGALQAQLDLGHGSGPLDHMWNNRLI